MTEDFLYYLWHWTKFDFTNIRCTNGDLLTIINPGIRNANSGPDFEAARIKINDLEWNGFVEMHVRASDWNKHRHYRDKAYNKVILHVVWEDDQPVQREDGTLIPTLELKNKVSGTLIDQYDHLISLEPPIPCATLLKQVDPLVVTSMIERSCIARLDSKSRFLLKLLKRNRGHWDKTLIQALAANFGFKKNKESFLKLTQSIPYSVLEKCRHEIISVEALLFGKAGFLTQKHATTYQTDLRNLYQHLRYKFNLDGRMESSEWIFSKLRPANFPTLRIAQFAATMACRQKLTSCLLDAKTIGDYSSIFDVQQSDFWQHHYHFNKSSKRKIGKLGNSSIFNILINTVAPFLYLYGKQIGDNSYIDRSVSLLEQIPAESNRIVKLWKEAGISIQKALDSQGLVELYNHYCAKKKCLNCKIGINLLQ